MRVPASFSEEAHNARVAAGKRVKPLAVPPCVAQGERVNAGTSEHPADKLKRAISQPRRSFDPENPSFAPKTNENHDLSQSPVSELPICREPLATQKGEASHTSRVSIRVVSFRRRLIDPDNLCPKYFIDCLRYAEIIKDDSAAHVTIQTEQVKVSEKGDERTEITID